jgi:hypothetical protein
MGSDRAVSQRPLSVTIVACLLVVTGVTGFAFHLYQVTPRHALDGWNVAVLAAQFVPLVCGAFVLRGDNWARWLAMAWIGVHVGISAFDSVAKVAIHAIIFALFAFCLFRPMASTYFRRVSLHS